MPTLLVVAVVALLATVAGSPHAEDLAPGLGHQRTVPPPTTTTTQSPPKANTPPHGNRPINTGHSTATASHHTTTPSSCRTNQARPKAHTTPAHVSGHRQRTPGTQTRAARPTARVDDVMHSTATPLPYPKRHPRG